MIASQYLCLCQENLSNFVSVTRKQENDIQQTLTSREEENKIKMTCKNDLRVNHHDLSSIESDAFFVIHKPNHYFMKTFENKPAYSIYGQCFGCLHSVFCCFVQKN